MLEMIQSLDPFYVWFGIFMWSLCQKNSLGLHDINTCPHPCAFYVNYVTSILDFGLLPYGATHVCASFKIAQPTGSTIFYDLETPKK